MLSKISEFRLDNEFKIFIVSLHINSLQSHTYNIIIFKIYQTQGDCTINLKGFAANK